MRSWRRFRQLVGLDPQRDVEHELSFHLDMRIRELVDQGVDPEEAQRRAWQRFGDYNGPRTECVEINVRRRDRMKRTDWIAELKQDVAYALRMLRRSPGFTFVAVATLALGIGANSAIFSVVHGVLLQSLPYRDADQLYRVRTLYPDRTPYALSAPDFASIKQDTRAFDRVEAYSSVTFTMLGQGEPREVNAVGVTDGLFDLMGLPLAQGRTFDRADHTPGRGTLVILDHGFWTQQFGGAPVLGRSVTLGGKPYTIVGVMGPGAELPLKANLYMPIEYDDQFNPAFSGNNRRSEYLGVIGHARPTVDAGAIDDDLNRIGQALQTTFPGTNATLTFQAASLRDVIVGDGRTPLLILLGAVGLVLLVACANVANLLLARASSRHEEIAVRIALGAGRSRVFRQLLTESVVLGCCGGVIGLALAYLGTRALVAAQPADIPRLETVHVNSTVMFFTLALSIVTGLACGLLPALQSTGRSLSASLREGGRGGSGGRGGRRVRAALVVGEMALAVMLLTGAGLLIRSFIEVTRVAEATATEGAMTFRFTLQGDKYPGAVRLRQAVADIDAALKALPGVNVVAASTIVPLGTRGSMIGFSVEGAPPPPASVNAEIAAASVTPDFFTAVGVPLRQGRLLTQRDAADAPLVTVINEAAVRRWFAGQDPIGRFVLANGQRVEVVGVAADLSQRDVRTPAAPQMFMSYAQRPTRTVRMIVRTTADPLIHVPAIRGAFRNVDPDLAVGVFTPFSELVETSIARPRFYTGLLSLFAGIALLLAAIGVFGVMNYAVTQQLREICIRMALGANAGGVLRMIVGRAIGLAAIGAALGLAGALALGRLIQSQLFGVSVFDPLTLTAVIAVLIGSAALASFLPARRAAALDPTGALRQG